MSDTQARQPVSPRATSPRATSPRATSPRATSPRAAPPRAAPPRAAQPRAAARAQAPATRLDGTPIRVLVVDDEPSLAELLASVLRYEGWEIRTAGDGAEAVRTAREFRPDAVVLDIMLPDFDGLEVLRRVRADLPHVCVLFLTANRGPGGRDHRRRR
jgi:two-component system, OmpR family, response regulator